LHVIEPPAGGSAGSQDPLHDLARPLTVPDGGTADNGDVGTRRRVMRPPTAETSDGPDASPAVRTTPPAMPNALLWANESKDKGPGPIQTVKHEEKHVSVPAG